MSKPAYFVCLFHLSSFKISEYDQLVGHTTNRNYSIDKMLALHTDPTRSYRPTVELRNIANIILGRRGEVWVITVIMKTGSKFVEKYTSEYAARVRIRYMQRIGAGRVVGLGAEGQCAASPAPDQPSEACPVP